MHYKRTILFFIFFLAVFIGLHAWGKLEWLDSGARRVINPLIHFFYTQNVRIKSIRFFEPKTELLAQLEDAENRLLQLQQLEATNAELLRENLELKTQIDFFREYGSTTWVVCNVIGKNLEERTSGLIIDCGSAQGLAAGQAAVAGDGILIGKIVEVTQNSAIVRLLNDSHSRAAVAVQNAANSTGVAEGKFGTGITLGFVPAGELLSDKETVISSGMEEAVPRGLILGAIEHIQKEPHEPFQTAIIRPPLAYDKLLLVSVVVNKKP